MTTPGSPPDWASIGRDLTARADTARESWRTPAHRRATEPAEAFAAARKADADNALLLGGIVTRHGWPGRSRVGEDGCRAAVAIAVHADPDRQLQSRILAALHAAAQQGEATPAQWAHVQDRVLVTSGRPQLYGTQYLFRPDGTGGRLELLPVVEPDALDRRRAQVGLPPHGEQDGLLRQRHLASLSTPGAPPTQLAERPAA
ncbi:DUF6624 domain-containing protein [Streptomyces sp. NRRL S-241]|uniref:DUF6624 domain-containing protein n=1 Tax=Streptomyces sp. NRRL S-241 TaxID=1463896 RepID=UPI00068C4CC5|nr:DUF6624 domain-containing protein [Streptomyces sp. NRRL S-241]